MKPLRFAVCGAGFWTRFQLAGWRETGGVECVALCNRTEGKARALAQELGIPKVYRDPAEMLRAERLDFLDIITAPDSHAEHVRLAAENRVSVICQKPMASSLAEAQSMVAACKETGTPFFVHENWRWQAPIRRLKAVLDAGSIGRPFRARISMVSGFPVFTNQPFFKTLDRFLLTDQGSHQMDVARFLFGEAESVACSIDRIHPDIRGEDVATVMLRMRAGVTVLVELGFAGNFLERDRHPETYLFVEGDRGSVEVAPDYWIRTTTRDGTHAKRHPPQRYSWTDPDYEVVQSSIVPCCANILAGLRGDGMAETTGEDNLLTVRLVFAAYEAALGGRVVRIAEEAP